MWANLQRNIENTTFFDVQKFGEYKEKTCNFASAYNKLINRRTWILATAIKAIPTLHGEDAIRFREEMEANKEHFFQDMKRDRSKDPFVIKMREMLRKSGLR